MLEAITKPFTNLIIQVDKHVFAGWSSNNPNFTDVDSLLAKKCTRDVYYNETTTM